MIKTKFIKLTQQKDKIVILFMPNHPQELQKTKYCRFLVRPSPIKELPKSLKNIFSIDKTQILQDLNDIKKQQNIINEYEICGDKEFKTTFMKTKKQQSLTNIPPQNPNAQDESFNPASKTNVNFNNSTITLFKNQPSHQIKQTIYMNNNHHQTFLSTLHKAQKNIMTRERKTLEKFKETQKEWQNIDSYLKLRLPKAQTITFGSVKKVYVHENPQRLELVNDVLPKYWQYSLRNNDKTLKSYIKGNKFKPQVAEEMLQTLKGTKRLQQSIPRIDSQRVKKDFARSDKIRLKAFSVQRDPGQSTMRQFHKNLFNTLNQTMRQRASQLQTTKSKLKSSRLTNFGNKTMSPKQAEQQVDTIEELNENEKRVYEFCQALQSLDRVDNEVYVKKYERKSKWLHEGLQIGQC